MRPRAFLASAFLTCAFGFGGAQSAFARWGVGNGGDELRLAFLKAKEHAAFVTLRLSDRSLPMALNVQLRSWLTDHHEILAADIAASQHFWTDEEQPTCAWTSGVISTEHPEGAIDFSYPTCRKSIGSADAASELLVHESVHHLKKSLPGGIDEEQFADQVALAVFDAWRSGATEWVATSAASQPEPRYLHSAIWTGHEMVVFGGLGTAGALASGARYSPDLDQWTKLDSGGPARFNHQAIWTGSEMLIWGGYIAKSTAAGTSYVWQNSGAAWDAKTGVWTKLTTPYGPAELSDLATYERAIQTLVWTGKEAVIFGGAPVSGVLPGGVYDPVKKTWRKLPTAGAPQRIAGHSAVWAEDRMIVFGGLDLARNKTGGGAALNLESGSWTVLPEMNAPTPRDGHTAVWTGSEMIIFGGFDGASEPNGTGGSFHVAMNAWRPIKTEAAQARLGHTAVWTGSEVLAYAGKSKRFQNNLFAAVSAFNPANAGWRIVDVASAPVARYGHSAVWTGSRMIVFGGRGANGVILNSGGSFYP